MNVLKHMGALISSCFYLGGMGLMSVAKPMIQNVFTGTNWYKYVGFNDSGIHKTNY